MVLPVLTRTGRARQMPHVRAVHVSVTAGLRTPVSLHTVSVVQVRKKNVCCAHVNFMCVCVCSIFLLKGNGVGRLVVYCCATKATFSL